ncbi:PaaI family thioesterase [Actinoplanes sp. NPDC026623]|uniref:PaaI family thioesterase n=1 Tax=Actinoplanes sp. NPDC026623 TaxID=3155610 RepID=UPI0033EE328D
MTGLESLRALTGSGDRPPHLGDLFGMEVVSIEHGSVVFAIRPQPRFANFSGTLHGGAYAILLDSAMGCAVHSALAAGLRCTAIELKVNFIRSVALDGGRLLASGKVIHLGRRTATAEGSINDESGRLVAHGSSTCLILPADEQTAVPR